MAVTDEVSATSRDGTVVLKLNKLNCLIRAVATTTTKKTT
jgi:hypothetical protein